MSPLNIVTSPWSFLSFTNKSQLGVFDNSKVDQCIQLTLRALDEDCRGDSDVALDTYFEALNCMLDALLLTRDLKKNKILQHKLATLLVKKYESLSCGPQLRRPMSDPNISRKLAQVDRARFSSANETAPEPGLPHTTFSNKVVNAAVAGAVALKQSPIPDAIFSTVNFTLRKAQAIDKYIGVQSLCWEVSKVGLNKAIELDAQYNLHKKFSAALMTSATAVIKAGIAYKEASSYQELKRSSEVRTC